MTEVAGERLRKASARPQQKEPTMFGDDHHPRDSGFDLTPEMEELLIACSRISLAALLDGSSSELGDADLVL